MAAHWSFGPVFELYRAIRGNVTAPEPTLADVLPTIVTSDALARPDGIVLAFAPFDPATQQAPTETRIYFAPDGESQPATADEFIARGLPYTSASTPVGPEGDPAYLVPHPVNIPDGDYIGRTLCYYPS